jgi:hypothetical protein
MKIVISRYGLLYLERAGTLKEQVCPFADGETSCGDWCPFFREPSGKTLTLACRAGDEGMEWWGDIEDQRGVTP